MLLWDIIRDWFVMNIWGGLTSNGDLYGGFIGQFYNSNDASYGTGGLTDIFVPVNLFFDNDFVGKVDYINVSDWLSTTSTIVVLILLCVVFSLMVRWLFRLTSGLLQGRG